MLPISSSNSLYLNFQDPKEIDLFDDFEEYELLVEKYNLSLSSLQTGQSNIQWEDQRQMLVHDLKETLLSVSSETKDAQMLHWFVRQGSLKAMEILLSNKETNYPQLFQEIRDLLYKGWDVRSYNDEGQALLHLVLKIGCNVDLDLIALLIQMGADPNECDKQNRTPFHFAVDCEKLNLEIIKFLLECKANVNAVDSNDQAPLHFAMSVSNPNLELIKILVDQGADIYAKNVECLSPFFLAAIKDPKSEITKFFESRGKKDWTPLHEAVINPQATVNDIKKIIANGAKINAKDKKGNTPLHWASASRNSNLEIIKCLIEMGADINVTDTNGNQPLHWAVVSPKKDLATLECLLEYGANINSKDNSGRTPLHIAVNHNKKQEVIHFLIERGADVHLTDSKGQTLLYIAVSRYSPNIEAIKSLIKKGADQFSIGSNGTTLLHVAACAKFPSPEVVSTLIENGADVNLKDKQGFTVLHSLALTPTLNLNHLEVIKILIKNKCIIDEPTHNQALNNLTPLYLTAYAALPSSTRIELISILLENGANSDVANSNGISFVQLILDKNLPIPIDLSKHLEYNWEHRRIKLLASSWNIPARSSIHTPSINISIPRNSGMWWIGKKENFRLFAKFSSARSESNLPALDIENLVKESYVPPVEAGLPPMSNGMRVQ